MTPEEIRQASKAGAKKLLQELSAGPFCNFCGMDKEHVGELVDGPAGVHICWLCADSALEVLKTRNRK